MENNDKKEKKGKSGEKKKKPYINVVFANDLSPELWREFREGVISANLKEHVPPHLQEPLIDKFVEAGLMAP